MKLGYKLLFGACVAANLIATSCVDDEIRKFIPG